ncbi:MAG TPA: carboxypeptidase-like regulatory domain-containing protein, partial [Gemmatimonadaceae bacterium]|nr:carboxypeptidase-like regulatory domain-containing protein [Gemmatimonadaceae bacterium]
MRFLLGAFALLLTPAAAIAQAAVISGRVTAEDRGALSDVAVSIPELGVGAITRDDGRFSITVPGARVTGQTVTLTARRIGYRAQSVSITLNPGTITQDIALPANPLQLGEVVVTGAGTTSTVERLGH